MRICACAHFHVPHVLARPHEQAGGIPKHCPEIEADVHMIGECVDVAPSQIADAYGRMTVVQQFQYIRSGGAHFLKPLSRNCATIRWIVVKPPLDREILLPSTIKGE